MNYGYLNTFVTSIDEDVSREINELLKYSSDVKVETLYTKRIYLDEIINNLQPGDNLYVYSFPRFCRGIEDLVELFRIIIDEKKANIISLHDDFDSSTEKGKIAKDVYARALPLLISDN
jgi:hypothetical protein